MGIDGRGNRRGKCTACDYDEFELPPTDDINMCFFVSIIESVINTINTIYKKTVEKGIGNILQLQKFFSLSRVKDHFLEQKVPTFENLITPSAGPKVYYNTIAWLVISKIDQLTIDVASAEEAVSLGLAIYFIKDLNYPSSFSQLLGLIETLCLNNNQFLAKEILSSCAS